MPIKIVTRGKSQKRRQKPNLKTAPSISLGFPARPRDTQITNESLSIARESCHVFAPRSEGFKIALGPCSFRFCPAQTNQWPRLCPRRIAASLIYFTWNFGASPDLHL
ncbi:hypothetical protein L484_011185 [Morus notabilis]|uniref:Uncharacterized protein n=1 Tax=Morus notabilis TaxID=981085 RepID=W9SYQ8_9ROSA|nr:hypothetical protein L484_011185 [Morus notabilis]